MIEQRTVIFNSEIVQKGTGKVHKAVISVVMYTDNKQTQVISSVYQVGFYTENADGKWRLSFGIANVDKSAIIDYYLRMVARLTYGIKRI